MRIIAGELRGRRLRAVEGRQTRPTASKVKGAVFNVLRDKLEGAFVLDLFAGTGSLALEALSRGAKEAVLVENGRAAARVIGANIRLAGMQERVRLWCMDAFVYLREHKDPVFDLIFLDPPYRLGLVDRALAELSEPCRLHPGGVIVAETAKDESILVPKRFETRKTASYGDTVVRYLQCTDVEPGR
ncbi:phosphatidylethanolamine N-methyltransferase [Acididesulfobacillus acetoxydans]|uniref:Phosphatidylethanolamine N-methyltransferase n=1 Tax=Acididesulfobacillus acetoxydans TaxID=1561005 RepID=A0A8S0W9N7_9FIRM|nr:16S rRNA (guanine(966)-N(2))-methyltransferase RsmD [Acididesulfobacillus acetoxydans]CAA7602739.1 phosphatidylethanolamine N-methyltransferase [Acididesulfobacillus acetoxydans]CEJ06404.1 RNA methyltransferase, RsmD [Acididesulfobacillus acetoxydans]